MAPPRVAKSKSAPTAVDLIKKRNAGREQERLARKYAIMRKDAFAFLRGTPNVFYQRMTAESLSPDGPAAWLSGDLHIENCGSYVGDNGLTYFDVNDFDSAMLAPAPWDVLRLTTSLLVAAPTLAVKRSDVTDLAHVVLEVWLETLRSGKSRWIERRTADGLIGELLQNLRRRNPVDFLDGRSTRTKGGRKLRVDGKKMLPVDEKEKAHLAKWLSTMPKNADEKRYFRLVDVAKRLAGVDSLGAPRYVLLIEGPGSPDGNLLLDLKSAEPGAGIPFSPCRQPKWTSDAERIIETQKMCQAVPMGFLSAVELDGKAFMLRQLQPTEDRLDLATASEEAQPFANAVRSMAELSAWAQLRASGHRASANADSLMAFGATRGLGKQLLEAAQRMEELTQEDWRAYCAAYDEGEFGTP